jgi:hypothetical protein
MMTMISDRRPVRGKPSMEAARRFRFPFFSSSFHPLFVLWGFVATERATRRFRDDSSTPKATGAPGGMAKEWTRRHVGGLRMGQGATVFDVGISHLATRRQHDWTSWRRNAGRERDWLGLPSGQQRQHTRLVLGTPVHRMNLVYFSLLVTVCTVYSALVKFF